MDKTCIVLAGGKGLRLGGDKLRETVGGSNLLQRVLSQLAAFNSEIIIVTAGDSPLPPIDGYQGCRIASDIYPGRGVLGGIYTGLVESSSTYNIVVACDMPFLNQALLRYMVGLAAGFELVLPRLGELVEPLHAVYARSCLAPIERLLKQDIMEVRPLFNMVKVRYMDSAEIEQFDPQHLSFFNVNTAADLAKARNMLLKGVVR